MKKRILSVILVLAMMLSFMAVPAGATVTYKDWSNVFWTSADDGLDAIPSQYSFTLADDTKDVLGKTPIYQVIDSEEADGKKNYLIIRLEAIAGRGRISTSTSQMYDPEVEGTLAYWIDNIWTRSVESEADYSSVLNVKGTLLNESFKDYLVEHEWVMEKCSAASLEQSSITAKAVIPSASEINYYVTKINGAALSTGTGMNSSLTRTTKATGKIVYVQGESATTGKLCMQPLSVSTTNYKRAWGMFWVSEDFFKNVKVKSFGADVSAEICNLNTAEELYALGYTYEELVAMGKIEAEVIPENVEISVEKAVPGYPVSVKVDGEAATEKTPVVWYVSATETGEYTAVLNATGNNWAITNSCANKYIKAGVNGVYSNVIAVGAGLETYSGTWWVPKDMPVETPKQYSFKLANPSTSNTKEAFFYQMLDSETIDGKKQYFIIQLGSYATNGQFSRDASNITFDPSVKMSMAGWLNDVWCVSDDPKVSEYTRSNGGPLNGNGTVMDKNLRDYLVKDRMWLTERSGAAGVENDFTTKATVSILSKGEILKYYNKIGSNDFATSKWTRTPVVQSEQNRVWYLQATGGNGSAYGPFAGAIPTANANYAIYPVFYLTEDFFKNVKLDISTAGEDVLAEVAALNTEEELSRIGYSTSEIKTILGLDQIGVPVLTLTDANGEAFRAGIDLGTDQKAYLNATINNPTDDEQTVTLMIARYESGVFSDAAMKTVKIAGGNAVSFMPGGENELYIEAVSSLDAVYKIFVWNGFLSMTPLCEEKVFYYHPESIKVLAIGNSFSVDALQYFYQIAEDAGVEEIKVGNLYIGSCSLQTHWNNAENNTEAYTYYKNTTGEFTNTKSTMLEALQDEDWDIIVMQQVSGSSGLPDTYEPYLTNLKDYVNDNKTNSDAKLAWHMTWAYQGDSSHAAFENYANNQLTMYNAIVDTVESNIVPDEDFAFIIPSGTAVQNARTSYIGDNLTRDGFHMSIPFGRYMTGLTWFKTLTGCTLDFIDYAPSGVSFKEIKVAKESANNACKTPFSVINSQYTE